MSYNIKTICHYTTILGLYGIIGSRGIRFGEFRNANDPREIFSDCKYKYISFTRDGSVKGWANPLMWYLYANKYGGVCIEFNRAKLLALNPGVKSFRIQYLPKEKIPHTYTEGIEPMKYKLDVWQGENEYRIAVNSTQELLKINIDCIEAIYFKNATAKTGQSVWYEKLNSIGLNHKLHNIAFERGLVYLLPIQLDKERNGYFAMGKVAKPIFKAELLTEEEIYYRCRKFYEDFTSNMPSTLNTYGVNRDGVPVEIWNND